MIHRYKLIASMLIFGTIGIFINFIPLPSSLIACARSFLGTLSLLLFFLFQRKPLQWTAVRKNGFLLLASGTALGFNWILLFESYARTGVSVGTVCYYMAPVFTVLLSPIVLKETLTPHKLLFTAIAVGGAVLISGMGTSTAADPYGIALGLLAGLLYSAIVLMNRKMKGISSMETTLVQLAVSAIVMLVYVALTVDFTQIHIEATPLLLLIVVGVLHTGVAYALFFEAANRLHAQTTSILSYIDPVTALLLSALILHQQMTLPQTIGAVLILGSTLAGEWLEHRKSKN